MTLPLESLKLEPAIPGTSLTWLQPWLLPLGCVMLFIGVLYFILFTLWFVEAYKKHTRPLTNNLLRMGISLTIIGLMLLIFTQSRVYEYRSDISIANISVNSNGAKVAFENDDARDDTLYTATFPKNQIDMLSDCEVITAKRMLSGHSDTIRLGAFTLDSQDNICTLKGKNK